MIARGRAESLTPVELNDVHGYLSKVKAPSAPRAAVQHITYQISLSMKRLPALVLAETCVAIGNYGPIIRLATAELGLKPTKRRRQQKKNLKRWECTR